MTKMTEKMGAFMREMAEVMDRHGVTEIMVTERDRGYVTEVEGVEFSMEHGYVEGAEHQGTEFVTIEGMWHTPSSIREEAPCGPTPSPVIDCT